MSRTRAEADAQREPGEEKRRDHATCYRNVTRGGLRPRHGDCLSRASESAELSPFFDFRPVISVDRATEFQVTWGEFDGT